MGFSFKKALKGGLIGGPVGMLYGSSKIRNGVKNFFGKQDRRNARAEAATADGLYRQASDYNDRAYTVAQEQKGAIGSEIDKLRDRNENIYQPMEGELIQAINTDNSTNVANSARDEFTTQFDANAQAQREQAMQYGMQPGSQQAIRMDRLNNYDRARGAANVANEARTEESDKQFLRKASFFNANGRGMESRIMNSLNAMYGADYNANLNHAAAIKSDGARHQGYSNAHAAKAGAGFGAIAKLGGMALGGPIGGAIGGAIGGMMGGGGQPAAQGAHGNGAVQNSQGGDSANIPFYLQRR